MFGIAGKTAQKTQTGGSHMAQRTTTERGTLETALRIARDAAAGRLKGYKRHDLYTDTRIAAPHVGKAIAEYDATCGLPMDRPWSVR